MRFAISVFTASTVTFALCYGSGWWLFDIIMPVLKRWHLEFMVTPGLVIGVFGAGLVWYWIASWVYEKLR